MSARLCLSLALLLLGPPVFAQSSDGELPEALLELRARAWQLAQDARREDMAGLAARVLEDWLRVVPHDAGFRQALGHRRDRRLQRWVASEAEPPRDGTPSPERALELSRRYQSWRNGVVAAARAGLEQDPWTARAQLLDALHAMGEQAPARRMRLRSLTIDPAALRLGLGVRGRIPNWAGAFESPPYTLWLLDLDGDGELAPGADGLALAEGRFVVQLPEQLLLPEGQCWLAIDGREMLSLRPEPLPLRSELVMAASPLLELRLRAGVPPLLLDAAASQALQLHLDYLALNGLTDGRAGLGIHDEDPEASGYTPLGAAAGRNSCLYPRVDSLTSALYDWYATPFHGVPLVSPTTGAAGIGFAHGVAGLYPTQRTPVHTPFMHPRPGARSVPTHFNARGELPNPAPGTNFAIGCGFPICVELPRSMWSDPLRRAELLGPDGPLEGYSSSPAAPAAPHDWPTNSGLLLFVPAAPLAQGTRYRVVFELESGWRFEWDFQTFGEG